MNDLVKYLSAAIVPMFMWFTARTTLQTKKQDSTSDITKQYLTDLQSRVTKLETENVRLRKIESKYNTLMSQFKTVKSENDNLNRRLQSMENLVRASKHQSPPNKTKQGGKKNVTDKPY